MEMDSVRHAAKLANFVEMGLLIIALPVMMDI